MAFLAWAALVAITCLPARAQAPASESVVPIEQRWLVALADQPSAPPVIDAGRVFVAIEHRQVDALLLADGQALWSVAIDAMSALAAGDGLLFVATSDGVTALDAATGAERWRTPVGASAAPPISQAGWVVASTDTGRAVALRAIDGTVVWSHELGAPPTAADIEGDRLYLPLADGRVVALRIDSGDQLWETRLDEAGQGVLAAGDRVYVGSLDNRFYCLAARNGRPLWHWRTGADLIGGAAVDAERVYFASLDNVLYALDRRTGVQRWKTPLPTRAVAGPSMAGTTVFIPVSSRTLLLAPNRRGRPVATVVLPTELFVASTFDAGRDVMVVAATVDTAGRAELAAFGRAAPLPLVPLTVVPGLAVGLPVPLVRTALPFQFLALPAPPRRGG